MDHNKLWTAARRREAARVHIPRVGRLRGQRQICKGRVQLGLGLLLINFAFLLLLLELAFMLGLLFAPEVL